MIDLSIISQHEYSKNKPFPYIVLDNALPLDIAKQCQDEILNLSPSSWKHLTSPFEDKMIAQLNDNLPDVCLKLYKFLESDEFCNTLSKLCGFEVQADETRIWRSIHMHRDTGGYLDMHCDAGLNPISNKTKTLTLLIYLSKNWHNDNGGQLELWNGDSVMLPKPNLYEKAHACIEPIFNRLVIFTNTENSWHGCPNPIVNERNDFARILLTLSYVSNTSDLNNTRNKAFFVPRPFDEWTEEKRNMAVLRSNASHYKKFVKCENIEK